MSHQCLRLAPFCTELGRRPSFPRKGWKLCIAPIGVEERAAGSRDARLPRSAFVSQTVSRTQLTRLSCGRIIVARPAYVPLPVLPLPRYGYAEERVVVTDW